MKILHISTYDSGGAANAMLNLHNSIIKGNMESKVLVLYKNKSLANVYSFLEGVRKRGHLSIRYRIYEVIKKALKMFLNDKNIPFTFTFTAFDITKHPLYTWADIIHIHWYHNFLDIRSFYKKNSKPIVFTLHDENIFLGGFHYSYDRLTEGKHMHLLDKIIQKKKLIVFKSNSYFVAPSKWLYNQLLAHKALNTHYIPYGLDIDQFSCYDRTQTRLEFGIDNSKILYLLIADDINIKRKGINAFLKEYQKLSNDNELLIIVGKSTNNISQKNCINYGFIGDKSKLAKLYSAVNIYINPTLADNLPNTVLESLSCGTPVVGFNIGGLPDLINERNGILSDEIGNFENLFLMARKLANSNLLKNEEIRNDLKKRFTLQNQLNKYITLYNKILYFKQNQ